MKKQGGRPTRKKAPAKPGRARVARKKPEKAEPSSLTVATLAPSSQLEGAVRTARRVADAALLRLEALETIEHAYEAWLELKLEHASFAARCAQERRKLTEQGSFLVGAVRAAAQSPGSGDALVRQGDDELQKYLREAESRLAGAREALERELGEEERHYAQAFARIREEVEARIVRTLAQVKPTVRLVLRSLAGGRTILHVDRVGPDEAVLLAYALTGRIPSRYGFLFDDSTDDVSLPPQPLYADEGLMPADLRPDAAGLRAIIERSDKVLPIKGFIPVRVPAAGGEALYRMLQRGAVMEVEVQEGTSFRNVLTREEGEQFAGHLLRLKLAGQLQLELTAG